MLQQIVIAGGGQAAVQAVDTLRRKGFAGKLTVVGDEPWLPYQRPPLSKKYLGGALERERLLIRPAQFFAEHQVEALLGRRVSEILRREQRVRLDDGLVLPYDALVLATGSRPRPLPAPGAELAGVHYLRTVADADRIRAECAVGGRMVIIGGGYIGLEVAATARGLGLEVTVLEMAERVMNRVICAQVSAFYESEHARQGVRILCNARVRALAGDPRSGRVRAVLTADGAEHPADIVIVAVGVAPADELATGAGLECDNGILIDQHCRTSDAAIYAAGDCANQLSPHYRRRLRLESVDNAFEQGTTVALNLLGTPTAHDKVPWFWSDQFDLKLVIIGMCQGYDTLVTRGAAAARSFSVCYLSGGELIAIDTVNQPKDQMAARKLIAAHARPDPNKLADAAIALRDTL
ncbi:MAG TPA: FAD-dependent oxidoreductase [Steroidobacteraceae bacterium]|nr:FAD-dependent oxidoreductase [Steroidobacteraceae bacterium]